MSKSPKNFLKAKRNFFFISITGALFLFVFLLDLAFYSRSSLPLNIYWTREAIIIVATLFLGLVVSRRHMEQKQNIVYKLKTTFFSIIGLYLAVAVPNFIFNENTFKFVKDYVQFFAILQSGLKNIITAVFVTTFLLINVFLVRDFIFYRSKKITHTFFNLGIILTGLVIIYGHYNRIVYTSDWSFWGRNPTEWVLIGLLFVLMALLSTRTAWVNYLNKRQKYTTFWAGILLFPGIVLFLQSDALASIQQFSFTLGTFDSIVAYFVFICLAASELSLLFHLPTASIFDKKMREIASLQSMSRLISSVLQYNEVVEKVTELAQDVLSADSCWLEMIEENGNLAIVSCRNLTPFEQNRMILKKDEGISGWIIKNKKSILINEVQKDGRSAYLRNFRKNIGSIVGVPLVSQTSVIGVLYAVKNEIFAFDQEDREMLQAFANQAAVAIENARLVESSLEKERLEQELRVAHDTQVKLLPKEMPKLAGLQIDSFCITANEVGGDYYDFVRLDDRKLGIVIGDVSGKGISAAFYMAELKGIVNSFAKQHHSPKEFMKHVNRTLYENVDRRTFVSMIYAVLDVQHKKLRFCRAGHCPLYYYEASKDRLHVLKPQGIGLALDHGEIFDVVIEEMNIKYHEGDFFLFFTDGLTEARNQQKEEYGEKRVYDLVFRLRQKPVHEIRAGIIRDVEEFMGNTNRHDDLSIICVKVDSLG